MFQSTLLLRAARLAAPAAATATVGVVCMTSSGDDLNQKIRGSTTTTTATALCDDKKKNEHASVIGMLGDIQARVSFVFFSSAENLNVWTFICVYAGVGDWIVR